jgi:hypothetical protein
LVEGTLVSRTFSPPNNEFDKAVEAVLFKYCAERKKNNRVQKITDELREKSLKSFQRYL